MAIAANNENDASVAAPVAADVPAPAVRPRTVAAERALVSLALLAILALGAYFRFTGLDWDGTYHLHPDERFLTDTASLLRGTDFLTYLRTSESPLNPYNVGKSFFVYGNFPMTVTRLAAEAGDALCRGALADSCRVQLTAYDGIHLAGRFLSALVDVITIVLTFLIGRRLYGRLAALVAAALMAFAVLPIQQSHFFTMDNWAAMFATAAVYAAVRVAAGGQRLRWWALFGLFLGLAVASRINVAPLAGLAAAAALLWLARRGERSPLACGWTYLGTHAGSVDLQRAVVGLIAAAFVSLAVFRVAQPYAFADGAIVRATAEAETGSPPGALELLVKSVVGLNPQWRANMEEIRNLQSPDASFPPALQWTDRAPILFPLTNMVLWGMGLTAGAAAWLAFVWALGRIVTARPDWTNHFLLVSWAGAYFLFMGTRWVKSIRYFLPIYPALFLLAGWALAELWRRAGGRARWRAAVALLIAAVIVPTFLWANAFLDIYRRPVTRVQASAWMLANIPSGATLSYEVNGRARELHLPLREHAFVPGAAPAFMDFTLPEDGVITGVTFNYLSDHEPAAEPDSLHLSLIDRRQNEMLADVSHPLTLGSERRPVTVELPDIPATAETAYTLLAEAGPGGTFQASTSIITAEHWDDPLPVRFEGIDPYFGFYSGLADGPMPVTVPDSDAKRQDVYRWLDEADYVVISSQRALWSVPRLPLTYPLMIRYYEALFSGELGFELVNQFHADLHIGPLYVDDVGGTFRWGAPPETGWPPPGPLAAEEAFSVYDHPPVWIFAKTAAYSPERVRAVLEPVDLSQVVAMTPGQATRSPNGLMLTEEEAAAQQANGTFGEIFDLDGVLARAPALSAVVWWLALALLGLLAFPIAFVALGGLPDRGYALARILGLLLLSYGVWLPASLDLLPNTRGTLFRVLALMAAVSAAVAWPRRRELVRFLRANAAWIGLTELAAVLLFALFLLVRLGNPDVWDVIWGGEKPMDLAYLNATIKSVTFPPYDPWYAGGYINYYYYGFVIVGSFIKLIGLVPTTAYNLIVPTLFSLTGLGAMSITYNLVAGRHRAVRPPSTEGAEPIEVNATARGLHRPAAAAGLVALALSVLLGNLAEPGVVVSAWHRAGEPVTATGVGLLDGLAQTADGLIDVTLRGESTPLYPGDWFWTASRAINANPGEAQPITEFPFFTFLYADLHAHMIALPVTLLALGWAVSTALKGDQPGAPRSPSRGGSAVTWFVGALAIGALLPTNTWDYPTYLLLGVIAVAFRAFRRARALSLRAIGEAAVNAAALVGLSYLLFWPFSEHFGGGYTSFSLWPGSYTHLRSYLAIYGLFLFLAITHLAREFRAWTRSWSDEGLVAWRPFAAPVIAALAVLAILLGFLLVKGYYVAPWVLPLALAAGLLALRPGLGPERRVVLFLLALALALTFFVELIVLDGDIGRMNTVFKFYLQVWILLSVVGGAAAVWVWAALARRPKLRRAWSAGLPLLVAAAALYPLLATKARWDVRMSPEAPVTLDGMAFMQTTRYTDVAYDGGAREIDLAPEYEALRWMQANIEGSPVVAEAVSNNPYRAAANRVAMYTGLPAIVGWDWHQRQQRAVLPGWLVSNRGQDVNTLYWTLDGSEARAILDRYGVRYIYVGQLEQAYYPPQGLAKFPQMAAAGALRAVYQNEGVTIYEVIG